MNKRLPLILLGLCGTMLFMVASLWLRADAGSPTATAHPYFAHLLSGSPERVEVWFAMTMAILMVAIICGVLIWGLLRAGEMTRLSAWMVCAFFGYAIIILLVIVSADEYLAEGSAFFGGFPVPSAMLLYGIWPFAYVFMLIYSLRFRADYLGVDEEERFQQVLADEKQRRL